MISKSVNSLRVAEALYEIFYSEFGSKSKGRYQISRDQLKQISGMNKLHETRINYIKSDLLEYGLLMISLEADFFLVEVNKVSAWRKVSQQVLKAQIRTLEREQSNKLRISKKRETQKIFIEKELEIGSSNEEKLSCNDQSENGLGVFDMLSGGQYVIESMEWEYKDADTDGYGFCDVTDKTSRFSFDANLKVISGLFVLSGEARNWLSDEQYVRSSNGSKSSQIILRLDGEQWFLQTDLYVESDEETHDKKWPIELVNLTESQITYCTEEASFTLYLHKEKIINI